MKKTYLTICLLSCLIISARLNGKSPEVEISNGILKARLYLPDSANGFYQATRFDWSGIIPSLEYKGHSFYGKWFERYNPLINDAVIGPVEEFAPLGYNDAKADGAFVKIGVGSLIRPDESEYNSFKLYKIENGGKWNVTKMPDQVQFVHTLTSADYSYEYTKTVSLTKGKPEMVLMHTIKNTGNKIIETTVYDHNFPVIDKQPTGPGYVIKFAFNPAGEGKGLGDLAQIHGNQITFLKEFAKSEFVYCSGLQGFGNNSKDYDFRIENIKTGAGMRITCNRPVSKLVFWCSPTTPCPEPYIQIKVLPGEEFSWKITYEYYTIE